MVFRKRKYRAFNVVIELILFKFVYVLLSTRLKIFYIESEIKGQGNVFRRQYACFENDFEVNDAFFLVSNNCYIIIFYLFILNFTV